MEEEGVAHRIAYDPTFGFIFQNLELTDSGTYTCEVDLKPEVQATINLHVSKRK